MKRILVPVGLLALLLAPAFAANQTAPGNKTQTRTSQTSPSSPTSPLDGTTWTVRVTPDDAAMQKGEKAFDDVIMFKNGKVAMSECVKAGFKASSYTTEKAGDGLAFRTEQASKKEGKSIWTGDVVGDNINGRLVWTKKDGTVLNYVFDGKRAGR